MHIEPYSVIIQLITGLTLYGNDSIFWQTKIYIFSKEKKNMKHKIHQIILITRHLFSLHSEGIMPVILITVNLHYIIPLNFHMSLKSEQTNITSHFPDSIHFRVNTQVNTLHENLIVSEDTY